ncbi:3-isopropylmalate dehydrogenase [Algibacter amylolyticus]|uniref:3-isopropylmalate dehydrogenase n=1 Tax=Algibacter amylolyticus TaxID=1608400 RepID=A0A5M7BFX6_9FLAO|nr:3-isopropylmalate dehydrogenase [Algibacter amylolyticus]KAA5826351.1 3-isopropylmalate dehydrogenase [Algibacter amylolyticus]MBB5268556.1 3-isopropylmalate dehydrogenase [Algibacter amylolyticus]TSJ80389.1 3-isopropylmalate dehydrogenase [Algibacter amylolyticus]
MKLNIAVLPGDGIGPEVTAQAVKVLKVVAMEFNHVFTFQNALVGACAIDKTGNPLPEETINICKNADAVLFGAIGNTKYDDDPDAKIRPEQGLLGIRKELGLHTNIRPIIAYDDLLSKSSLKSKQIKDTNILIYRELTSGIYFGDRHLSDDGNIATDICKYERFEIERVTHSAFKAAQSRKRKLTLVDKANVLETSRLWRRIVKEIAPQYPDVRVNCTYVDNAAMELIIKPRQFDVILTENMFGDILSEEASVIVGSIGLLASASIGDKHAMFEPIHGAYTKAANRGIANPIASILSAAMLLDHFGLDEEAAIVREGVGKSLKLHITTPDLNNKYDNISTTKVGDFIEDFIQNPDETNLNFTNIHLGQSTII